MTTDPLLDACLIVRDEEANLPACLESLTALGPLLGRVCVYDTGSMDATVDIARAAGADVAEGYWDGDFARARNESLAMASATWALIIDADEQVIADAESLRALLTRARGHDVFNASLSHVDDTGRVIGHSSYGAILRMSSVVYRGRVHEVAVRTDGCPPVTVDLPPEVLTFTHTGYATAEVRHAKAERNAAVAEAGLLDALDAGDPQRIGEAYYHHARSVGRLGRDSQAIDHLLAAWSAFEPASIGRDRVALHLVPALLAEGRAGDASALLREHLADGGSADIVRLLLSDIARASGCPAEALAALAAIPPEGSPEHDVHPRDVLARQMAIFDDEEQWDEALACCLVLVGRWQEYARVEELLARVDGQPHDVVAQLLGGASVDDAALSHALRASGPEGIAVAQHLLQ